MCKVYSPKTPNLIFQKKGLRHFAFAYDKEMSEYMSKILFSKNEILFFELHVSLRMSEKRQNTCLRSYYLFSKNKILFFELHLSFVHTYNREMLEHMSTLRRPTFTSNGLAGHCWGRKCSKLKLAGHWGEVEGKSSTNNSDIRLAGHRGQLF